MQAECLMSESGHTIQGPLLIKPRVFADVRGYFFESWNQRTFASALEADGQQVLPFLQDNHSRSRRGVLRGLHYQLPPSPQGKLVRCVSGSIFDVAVDLRRDSATFGRWVAAELTSENHQQLWVPMGFAHGFLTLSEHAEVLYKTTDFWCKDSERGLLWDDPELAITWPLQATSSNPPSTELPVSPTEPLLAEKDAAAPSLLEALRAGDVF